MKPVVTKIVLFIILALGLLVLYLLYSERQENKRLQKDMAALQTIISTKPQLIKKDSIVYQDVNHNIYENVYVDRNVPVEKRIAIGQPLLDSITKALQIQERDLIAARQINARLFVTNQKLTETSKGKIEYKDHYFSIKVDKDSNMLTDMRYNLVLTNIDYEKPKGFLQSKEQLIDIFSPDKRVTIGGVKSFTVRPKQLASRLFISNQATISPKNANSSTLTSQLKYEMGLNKTLTWSIGGGYTYNFKELYPTLSTELQINIFKHRK